jgi:threonine dehydratase
VGVAAILAGTVRIGGPVAVLVTGANVDVTVLARIVGEKAVRSR